MGRRNNWQKWVVVTLAVLVMLALVLSMGSNLAVAGQSDPPDRNAQSAQDDGAGDGPDVVVIGTAGLRWEDLTALATPNLWELAERGAAANLVARSVRSFSCPADGWLAVSSGRRAADQPMEDYGTCRRLLSPDSEGSVPAWEGFLEAAAVDGYDARPGLLGDVLTDAEISALAVGPGAAVGLAGRNGVVAGDYLFADSEPAVLQSSLTSHLPGHDLAMVDVGAVRDHNRPLVHPVPEDETATEEPDPEETPAPEPDEAWLLTSPERSEQVARLDERVGAVVEAVRAVSPNATILLASVADSGSVAAMQLALADGPEVLGELPDEGGALLESRSTRQPGMIQSTDLTPTILRMLDVDAPPGLVGAPALASPDQGTARERVDDLADEQRHAAAVRPLRGPFTSVLVLVNLLLYAAVIVGLNRRFLDRTAAWLDRRRSAAAARTAAALRSRRPGAPLRTVRAVAVGVGSLPVASYLANLLPWWQADNPALVHLGAVAMITIGIASIALTRPWRSQLLTPVAVVVGLTAAVLAVDVVTGARLQVSALLGIQPEVGGRFYGFNNSSFSLFAASLILVATCLADPLVRRGHRKRAAALVLALGAVAVVLVGHPSIGADFGGPPALIPGMLILALLVAGVRLTWQRILLVLAATGVLAASFSLLDWLRPPEDRTHLGRFVETVLDGGLWPIVIRKVEQNLANLFGSVLTLMAIGGIIVVLLLLARPLREAARSSRAGAYGWLTGERTPGVARLAAMLRPALISLGVTFVIGFAANDSGIVLPAIAISIAVPLLVAVLTGWLLGRSRAAQLPAGSGPERADGDEPGDGLSDDGGASADAPSEDSPSGGVAQAR